MFPRWLTPWRGTSREPNPDPLRRGTMILAFVLAPLAALFLAVMTYAGR
jgi:hypothetical protein